MDDLYDYIDYEDIKKAAFLVNKGGFKLSEKDLERFFTEELERLAYKKFKEWVELRNPKSEIDIIKLFLRYDIELRDEIEEIIDDVDDDMDEYIDEAYLESIIGSRLKYLIKILRDYNIELSKKEIYNKIEEIIEKERLKKFEDELKLKYLKKSVDTSKENDLLIRWEDVIKMNGYDFESFIENLFRSLGFNVMLRKLVTRRIKELI